MTGLVKFTTTGERRTIAIVAPDIGVTPYDWQEDALCAQTDLEAFFPDKGGSTVDAKKICARCDVTAQCLAYALKTGERHGIWGGLSERQRRPLMKQDAA